MPDSYKEDRDSFRNNPRSRSRRKDRWKTGLPAFPGFLRRWVALRRRLRRSPKGLPARSPALRIRWLQLTLQLRLLCLALWHREWIGRGAPRAVRLRLPAAAATLLELTLRLPRQPLPEP